MRCQRRNILNETSSTSRTLRRLQDSDALLPLHFDMPPALQLDTKTRVARIRDVCDTLQSAWLARPSLDHPQRAVWEQGCRDELLNLKVLVRHVTDVTPVPPLCLAFLVEHNRAYTARERKYDYEALRPDNSYGDAGLFVRDKSYRFCAKETGWWTKIGTLLFPPSPSPQVMTVRPCNSCDCLCNARKLW